MEDFLQIQKFVFKLQGIDLSQNFNSRWNNCLMTINFLIPIIGMIGLWSCLIENLDKVEIITESLAPILVGILTSVKLLTFWSQKGKFIEILKNLENILNTCKQVLLSYYLL